MNELTLENVEIRFQLFQFFYHYYSGEALTSEYKEWKEVAEYLNKQSLPFYNESFVKGITILNSITEDDVHSLKYDYAKLFIGPKNMLASPYESSYRNFEQLLMQKETLQVRNFYMQAGLAVTNCDSEPDDHMSLELEFICYLLANIAKQPEHEQLYERFLMNHLFKWYEQHCSNINKHAKNNICKAMGYLLFGFLSEERNRLINLDLGGR